MSARVNPPFGGATEELPVSYAKGAFMRVWGSSQNHHAGPGWLADAAAEPAAPALGSWERPYRDVYWRAYLGGRVYGVYGALIAAGEMGRGGLAAVWGSGDRRGFPALLARLEEESLAWAHRDGRAWVFDVLRMLPPLAPAQAARLPRALRNEHLECLGLMPEFDLPAWWRRKEPTFAPYAVRAFGLARIGGETR